MSAFKTLRAGDYPGIYSAFGELGGTREQVMEARQPFICVCIRSGSRDHNGRGELPSVHKEVWKDSQSHASISNTEKCLLPQSADHSGKIS